MNFNDVKKEIGKRVKELRQKKDESQEDLANAINLSQNSISKMERGEVALTLENQLNIAEHYNVSLDYLIKGKKNDAVLDVLMRYISLTYSYIDKDTGSYTNSPVLRIDSALIDYLMSYTCIESILDMPYDIKNNWLNHITDTFYKMIKDNPRTSLYIPISPSSTISYPDDYEREWNQQNYLQKSGILSGNLWQNIQSETK